MKLTEKWTRAKAHDVREIIDRLGLCSCGSGTAWQCVLEILTEAETHTEKGFYRDPWFELAAKFLDKHKLLDHGTSIGFAWLSDDGRLLLEFLRDFGTNDERFPRWSIEFQWHADSFDTNDVHGQWVAENSADLAQKPTDPEKPSVSC